MSGFSLPTLSFFIAWMVSIFCFAGVWGPFETVYPTITGSLFFAAAFFKHPGAPHTAEPTFDRGWLLAFAALFGLFCFQLIPLPETLLQIISPWSFENTFGFLRKIQVDGKSAYPISADPEATTSAIKLFLGFSFLFFLCGMLPRSYEAKKKCALLFIYGSVVIAIVGILNLFSGSQKVLWLFAKGHTFFGPFLSKNHAGAMLSMACVLCFPMLFSKRLKRTKIFLVNAFAFLFFTILFIGSRAALLTTVLFCAIHLVIERRLVTKKILYALLGASAAVLLLSLFWKAAFFSRWASGNGYRISFWKYALQLAKESPLFGVGLGAFSSISPRLVGVDQWIHPEHVENEYLEIAATLGMVGAAIVGFMLFRLQKIARPAYGDAKSSTVSKGFVLAFFAFLFHCLFVFHAPVPAQHFLFCFLTYGILPDTVSAATPWRRRYFATACLVVGIACTLHGWMSKNSNGLETADQPLSGDFFSAKNRGATMLIEQDRHDQRREHVIEKPYATDGLYDYAQLELLFGDRTRAKALADEAMYRSPLDVAHRLPLTAIFAQRGYSSDAETWSRQLLGGKFPLAIGVQAKIHLDLAYAAFFHDAQTDKVASYLQKARTLSPQHWELLLYSGFVDGHDVNFFPASWRQFKLTGLPAATWDRKFFALMRHQQLDPSKAWAALLYARPDLIDILPPGSVLKVWPLEIPQAKLAMLEDPSHYRWDGSTLTVDVIDHTSRIDRIFLPIDIGRRVDAGIRMVVKSDRNLGQQLLYTAEGRHYSAPGQCKSLGRQRWELTIFSLEKRLTEIGFTPLEKNGTYAVESIEIFVKSKG